MTRAWPRRTIRCRKLLEKAVIALQRERHFRNKHAVGITAGNCRGAGDEARVAAHQLDQANSISGASRLSMCRGDGIDRGGASRFVPEAFVHVGHIVVDGLRDPDDREFVAAPVASSPMARPPRWVPSPPTTKRMLTFHSISWSTIRLVS